MGTRRLEGTTQRSVLHTSEPLPQWGEGEGEGEGGTAARLPHGEKTTLAHGLSCV